jgi:hypothetical protein
VDWIGLAQDRNRWRVLMNSVLNLQVPWNGGKLSSGPTSSVHSSSVQLHRVYELVRLITVKSHVHSHLLCVLIRATNLSISLCHFVLLPSNNNFLQFGLDSRHYYPSHFIFHRYFLLGSIITVNLPRPCSL